MLFLPRHRRPATAPPNRAISWYQRVPVQIRSRPNSFSPPAEGGRAIRGALIERHAGPLGASALKRFETIGTVTTRPPKHATARREPTSHLMASITRATLCRLALRQSRPSSPQLRDRRQPVRPRFALGSEPNEPGPGGGRAPARLERRHTDGISAAEGSGPPLVHLDPLSRNRAKHHEGATRGDGKHQKVGPPRPLPRPPVERGRADPCERGWATPRRRTRSIGLRLRS